MKNMNNDLISRQAAIEIVERYDKSHMVLKQRPMLGAASIVMELEDLPSVQTEKMQLSEEDATKGTTFDYIDRQAAIDALDALCDRECEYSKQQRSFMCGACRLGSAFDVIDELPSAQPEHLVKESGNLVNGLVNDCISRQAAIDAINALHEKPNAWLDSAVDAVMTLPSAQPQRWIPVTEALPEEDGQYLITVKYKHVNDSYEDIYAEHGEWFEGKWDMFCFGHCGEVEGIIAWMPLPEPYAERRHDKNDKRRA